MCAKYGFDAKAIRKMNEVFQEQEMPSKMNFGKFLKFLRLDDAPILRNIYESVAGSMTASVDARVLMLYMMNCSSMAKEEKLKFAFNLFD